MNTVVGAASFTLNSGSTTSGTFSVNIGGTMNSGTYAQQPNGNWGGIAGNAHFEISWSCNGESGMWEWKELITMSTGTLM